LPYPYHRDRQQYLNAEVLARAGAAVIVDDVGDTAQRSNALWRALEPLLEDCNKRHGMAEQARHVAQTNAAAYIARHLLERT
jgi:UDP-N-acetylglucosamine--N-acetylmuramyl-(pentapeptide) pyrophosphoryl-undecaprenol N-acetylglucosamine transferase